MLAQRAELTFKQNREHGRHGWLRLTPAYSIKVVESVLAEHGAHAAKVLDPFNGSGTTPLCASYAGRIGIGIDVNPFLIWLGQVKARKYSPEEAAEFHDAARGVARGLRSLRLVPPPPPPLSNIDRWWKADSLKALCALKALADARHPGPVRDLLLVAFCRTMIRTSNAAFNHQSMSFKVPRGTEPRQLALLPESRAESSRVADLFLQDADQVAEDLGDNPGGQAIFVQDDSRRLPGEKVGALGVVDLVITSPPYVNRMSYIRELRPYMYWLGFLKEAAAAGELDWRAIGGTWGIATSRLLTWVPEDRYVPAALPPLVEAIRAAHPKNGVLMSQYVHRYFEDMSAHLERIHELLVSGGSAHYIVGNSTFYGHMVPAHLWYADIMHHVGFVDVQVVALRKRNSKKDLVEYRVSGTRP